MREADYVKQLPRRLGLISLQPRPLTQFTGWHSAGKDPEPPGARALVCHGLLRLICLADFPAWGVSLLRPSLSVLFWGSACSTALSAPRTPAPRPAWGGAPSSCLCVSSPGPTWGCREDIPTPPRTPGSWICCSVIYCLLEDLCLGCRGDKGFQTFLLLSSSVPAGEMPFLPRPRQEAQDQTGLDAGSPVPALCICG